MAVTRTLADMLDGWPSDVADCLSELITYDLRTLDSVLDERGVSDAVRSVILDLRSQALDVKIASDKESPLNTPEAVATALGTTLSPPANKWITYPLDARRRRISAPHKVGGSRFLCTISAKVPSIDDLTPLDEGGVYLLVRRSSPDVLSIAGVVERLATLSRTEKLCDVVFYERSESLAVASKVYSLRCMRAMAGSSEIPFDLSDEVREKVRKLWT